ncbi:MAG: hypothetical protein L6R48_10775 [Planctomycetes bacterium]|nr:hypothetical protein [Planctomycetota bacterium]
MIHWTPHLPPVVVAGLLLGGGAGLWWLHARLAATRGRGVAWLLVAPKAALLALLALAVLDPGLAVDGADQGRRTLWLLLDRSASMAVRDTPGGTRAERAARVADTLAKAAPAGVRVERRWFDTALHDADQGPPGDGTDLAACLQALARPAAAVDTVGVVVVSDGGDEPVAPEAAPALPISAVAVGGPTAALDDLAVAALAAPEAIERGIEAEVVVDAVARGSAGFLAGCGSVAVTLERRRGLGAWQAVGSSGVDLRQGRARATFRLKEDAPGAVQVRASVAELKGEVSLLDNRRSAVVEVRERSLHVLYWSRSLGVEIKLLRGELGRDPGVTLTAAYRTMGERFAIQGDRVAGDEALATGLPADPAGLRGFDVVVLGSFPAEALKPASRTALAAWVEGGGALVLLGGEESFGRGGWTRGELAPLVPWQGGGDEPAPERGTFPVAVAAGAQAHAVVRGLAEALAGGAGIASRNRPGALRPGAQALLTVDSAGGSAPLVAWQPYGRGKVMGIATDSLWRLHQSNARSGGGADPYGLFWRQAVRFLADRAEGGRVLKVAFDRARYRPGDTAQATVTAAADGPVRITAALAAPDGVRRDLALENAPGGLRTLAVPFTARGTWTLRLAAYADGNLLETWERVLEVAPALPEGARLERDEDGLRRLASGRGGLAVGEEDPAAVVNWVAAQSRARSAVTVRSLVFGAPWWLAAVVLVLLTEWWIRRKRGLI